LEPIQTKSSSNICGKKKKSESKKRRFRVFQEFQEPQRTDQFS